MPKTRYGDHWKEWDHFVKAVETNVNELPHLAAAHADLIAVLSNVRLLISQQGALRASKQEISKQIKAAMQEGRRIANFLRVGIIHHYGPANEKLAEFGLLPFRSRSRQVKKASAEVPPAAAEPGSAS